MEKFPSNRIKKINQIRKVASAAMHIASMDATHAALKPEDYTASINKKPETETVQIQQEGAAPGHSLLDEQLKRQSDIYFSKERLAFEHTLPKTKNERFENFRRSNNIEDRRENDTSDILGGFITEKIGAVTKDTKHPFTHQNAVETSSTEPDSTLAKEAGMEDLDTIAPRLKAEVDKRHALEAVEQAQTNSQYEEYRKVNDKIEHTWDTKGLE